MGIERCHIGFMLESEADGRLKVLFVENPQADICGDALERYGSRKGCLVSSAARWVDGENERKKKGRNQ